MHEQVPEAGAHQAAKFQQINQAFNAFKSVLLEVIEDCNNYIQGQQGKLERIVITKTYLF